MSANETGTFDPHQIQQSLGSLLLGDETAFADGTFVKFEWDDPKRFKHKIGAMGHGARAKNRNRAALITVTFLATAAINDDLIALHDSDYNSGNGAGVMPYLLKDLGGTTLIQAADAYIEEIPGIEYSTEVGTREWKIRLIRVTKAVLGGSTLPTS